MAVAKDRLPVNRTLERVPHSKIAYAFLDIETTGTVDEFLAYREEMLKKHPLYGPSALEKPVTVAEVAAPSVETPAVVAEPEAEQASATVAPTGQSARDIARAKVLAKRGAK